MSQQENRISDSHFSKWIESSTPLADDLEIVRLSAARARWGIRYAAASRIDQRRLRFSGSAAQSG
jgi:hypothetical protein